MVDQAGTRIENHLRPEEAASDQIKVIISYEIIRLFSEGLYQSPHKAIEELVANSFDAGAENVFIILPRQIGAAVNNDSLWVIDDGTGMDAEAFRMLWRVADSRKYADTGGIKGRRLIGQFGIGKLAAYVLAWRLTHISKTGSGFLYTSMNFHQVEGRHQYDVQSEPMTVGLHVIQEDEARNLLLEVEERDPRAWARLFGDDAVPTWTAAALSDFKDLYGRLTEGRLAWVLRTGLPLVTAFNMYLNGDSLESSKENLPLLLELAVGGEKDVPADSLELSYNNDGVEFPGIGVVTGHARLFERSLTSGKSDQYQRSHGFFVRVRERVINLEDELFGIEALNHAAWAHFSMEIKADGLRDHLLSSREGVRDSAAVDTLRKYLHMKFNICRNEYDKIDREQLIGIDIATLLAQGPSMAFVAPLAEAIREEVTQPGRQLYYIDAPKELSLEEGREWLEAHIEQVENQPFASLDLRKGSPYEQLAHYDAANRQLQINRNHPFISKILLNSKNQTPATLISSAEIITDALLRQFGIPSQTAIEFFNVRDRVLRLLAGQFDPDPAEVMRHLTIAPTDKDALEIAVGEAFTVLGFGYDKRGGNEPGPDGVLDASLGRHGKINASYRVVYDAKTTDEPRVPADKVDLTALWDFKRTEGADYAFVIAKGFQGQDDREAALSRRVRQQVQNNQPVSLLLVEDLKRVVKLHYRHGVTLTQLRGLFDAAHTVEETHAWVDNLERELSDPTFQVPLERLLNMLEAAKGDPMSAPNIYAVRATDAELKVFEPERLIAAIAALGDVVGAHWLEVNRAGEVKLHQTAGGIIRELGRRLATDLTMLDE